MSYFKTTPTRVVKSTGASKTASVGSNGNRAKASATAPAPLVRKCASCGRKK